MAVVASALVPAAASAEPLCTNTWTGGGAGNWSVAGNWSAGHTPTSSDVACIGASTTVSVTEGGNVAGVLVDKGTLAQTGGTLEITSALEPSSIGTLKTGASTVLAGAATIKITSSWTSEGGRMSGTGSTVILPGASATIGVGTSVFELNTRSLVNEGTTTFNEGRIFEYESAQIRNSGTFIANSETVESPFQVGSGAPRIVNTGLFEKTAGAGAIGFGGPSFENRGTLNAKTGAFRFGAGSATLASGSTLEGNIDIRGASVTSESMNAAKATLSVTSGSLTVASGGTATVGAFVLAGGTLTGAGTLAVSGSFTGKGGRMLGSGTTVLQAGSTSSLGLGNSIFELWERTFLNQGTITSDEGAIFMYEGAHFTNAGTFKANSEKSFSQFSEGGYGVGYITNTGLFEKTLGTGTTIVEPQVTNQGTIRAETGAFEFRHPVYTAEASSQYGGGGNPSTPGQPHPSCGDPVSCATGNFSETQTDLSVGGRGVGLDLARTYNSQAAAAGVHGAFGYGWSSSFSDHLIVEPAARVATLVQAEGSTVPFSEGTGGAYTAPAWTQDTLSGTEALGYTLTLRDQTVYRFSGSSGRLESVTDRNSNATIVAYNGEGRLESVADPAGRKLVLAYNGEGLVETVKDPMGHVAKYAYEGGNLASVTEPGELSPRWRFKYDGSHQATEIFDGKGGKTENVYNGAHQVTSQIDPAGRTLNFAYEAFRTKITNAGTGSVTDEHFTSADLPSYITRGYGTPIATTESWGYDAASDVLSTTDGNNHVTKYSYDASANRTSMLDPEKDETKWTYDTAHDVETTTTPKGETTTIKRDTRGNAESISRPAPAGKTQTTKYKYAAHGELESVTDPLERTSKYEYNTHGDRTGETDPEGDKRTWTYDEDSRESTTVSPNGHVVGAKESKFATTIARDEQGRPTTVMTPLLHATKYVYDANGNIETVTDPEARTTKYIYNADNQPVTVEAPNATSIRTEYDAAGQVSSQSDGNEHATKYTHNVLGQVSEVTDPVGHKTTKEYDAGGSLKALTDAAKHTATYLYDAADRLKEISYSDGKTPTVSYEYDRDGDRTAMVDGTGRSSYEYDQLDRLISAKGGHGDSSGDEYDLANESTKITYPGGKAVSRTYDGAGRLKSVTDWLEHTTQFGYDADSNLTTTAFPVATSTEDSYAYDEADAMREVKMTKGAELLASLVYVRNKDGGVTKATTKGLPGEEVPAFTYDTNSRLTKGSGTVYKYDAANNPTTIGTETYKYDAAGELERRLLKTAMTATYTYDEVGERAKATPAAGAATTYSDDQAGNLTAVARPKEGATPAIEDSYTYDGNGLRASQTSSATTSYLTWDTGQPTALLLSDGSSSYIYGVGGLPIEQVSGEGTVSYLHHDQQGSTRLLTGVTGTVIGTATYGPYGGVIGSTGATPAPLGYDGQYTSGDTGLVYLRARVYDPSTAQFLSRDPLVSTTREPYGYAGAAPLSYTDPSGLLFDIPGTPTTSEVVQGAVGGLEKVGTRVVGFVNGFTRPAFGGTEALGLGGLVNTCSMEYQVAREIGGYTLAAEGLASAVYGVVYGAGEAGYAAATRTDLGNTLFGRVFRGIGTGPAGSPALTGTLNSGAVRVGIGWRGDAAAGENLFRVGVGESHFDFFH